MQLAKKDSLVRQPIVKGKGMTFAASHDDVESAGPPVTTTLFAGQEVELTELDERVMQVVAAWRRIGDDASFQEMLAVANGSQPNRMFELVGRIAATGEQLVLAGAFRDARGRDFLRRARRATPAPARSKRLCADSVAPSRPATSRIQVGTHIARRSANMTAYPRTHSLEETTK